MAEKISLKVQPRDKKGNQVRRLRREGVIPANIYGAKIDSVAIQVQTVELIRLVNHVGESEIVYVLIEGEKAERPVLIADVQKDPVSQELLHVDLRQIDLSEEVTVPVALVFDGESPATKLPNAVLLEVLDEIEVTSLPDKLPSEIRIDVSRLENIGDQILVGDLTLGEGIVIEADPEQLICKIDEVRVQAEETETSEETEETGEATAEEASEPQSSPEESEE